MIKRNVKEEIMKIVNGEWDVQKNVVKWFFKGLKMEILERFKPSKKVKDGGENNSSNKEKTGNEKQV